MKRGMVFVAVLLGLLLGLGSVHFGERLISGQLGEAGVGTVLPPPGPELQEDPTAPGGGNSKVVDTSVTILSDGGLFLRIRRDIPKLFLEDHDGGRAVIQTYYSRDPSHLHLTHVEGLRPTWYGLLIARYEDGEEELVPIDLDLTTRSQL